MLILQVQTWKYACKKAQHRDDHTETSEKGIAEQVQNVTKPYSRAIQQDLASLWVKDKERQCYCLQSCWDGSPATWRQQLVTSNLKASIQQITPIAIIKGQPANKTWKEDKKWELSNNVMGFL